MSSDHQPHAGGRPPQRVEPGPGLRAEDFSWGRWEKYLTPLDMAAYRCLRQCALSTRQLGWRPFAQAIGGGTLEKPGIDKQRLRRIFEFLEEYAFIAVPEWGQLIPRIVVVLEIADHPSLEQVAALEDRKLRRQGPPRAVVDEFIRFFAGEYERKTHHPYPYMDYHRRSAIHLLKIYSLDRLKHLTAFYVWYMGRPHTLGDLVKRIALVAEKCGQEDAKDDKARFPQTQEQQEAIDAYNKACAEYDAAYYAADTDAATWQRLANLREQREQELKDAFVILMNHPRRSAGCGFTGMPKHPKDIA